MGWHDGIVEYEWSGKTRYRCPYCPFDDSKKVLVKVHINQVHAVQETPPRRMEVPLYDAAGKLIETIEGEQR